MNLVDSCAWIEYARNEGNAGFFSSSIENLSELIVPTICLYEVFKKISQESGEKDAMTVIVHMKLGRVVEFDSTLALEAARISKERRLAMADSIIYATTLKFNATLWTQDDHFEGLPSVQFKAKPKAKK